ncbi:hypothetical protein [Streptomyces mirabilis]|uniref:hypothetical protein n=1 Tax=Streptomyces mirabilis TaxID=68239 RepID=UPI003650C10F
MLLGQTFQGAYVGISAAGSALALTLLGRQDIALYDGSLKEWWQDPSRPLTTGT